MVFLTLIGITAAVTCVGTFFLFRPSSAGGQHSAAEATASVYNKNSVNVQQGSITVTEIVILMFLLVVIVSTFKKKIKKWFVGQEQQLPMVVSTVKTTTEPQPQSEAVMHV